MITKNGFPVFGHDQCMKIAFSGCCTISTCLSCVTAKHVSNSFHKYVDTASRECDV